MKTLSKTNLHFSNVKILFFVPLGQEKVISKDTKKLRVKTHNFFIQTWIFDRFKPFES